MANLEKLINNKTINIIPVAGKGLRFKEAGFKTHKSLLKYKGKPVFIQSAKSLPKAKLNIFILKKRNKNEYSAQLSEIKKNFKFNSKVITLQNETRGQADTIYKIKRFIPKNSIINIASSDTICKFNQRKYYQMIKSHDALVWSSKPSAFQIKNLDQFGTIFKKRDKLFIYCKKKIKNKNISIVTGFFSFKSRDNIFNIIKSARKNKKYFINNEIYLDTIFQIFSKRYNDKIGILFISKMISFGTPDEFIKNKSIT